MKNIPNDTVEGWSMCLSDRIESTTVLGSMRLLYKNKLVSFKFKEMAFYVESIDLDLKKNFTNLTYDTLEEDIGPLSALMSE